MNRFVLVLKFVEGVGQDPFDPYNIVSSPG